MFIPGLSASRLAVRSYASDITRPRQPTDFFRVEAERAELSRTFRSVRELVEGIDALQEALEPGIVQGRSAAATSASKLALDQSYAFTTLTSSSEVNATPTSYGPFGPTIAGTSTSEPTVDGVYTGAADSTLTFKVKKEGTVGSNSKDIRVEVRDGGKVIDQIVLDPGAAPDTPISLSNGLEVSFSAGTLDRDDTFTVDVFATVGSTVDPDKAFDGVRNDRPNFEYGVTVGAGTFSINGVDIDVQADDTIRSVLSRITASGAGVTATYDAATESVTLTRNDYGPEDITLGPDSSGFLAAVKLAGSTPTLGWYPDSEKKMSEVAAFAGVTAGQIEINGVAISLDPAVDSLQDVMDRITPSSASATASLNGSADRLTISSIGRGRDLLVSDRGTGFLAAVDIAERRYEHEPVRGIRADDAQDALRDVTAAFDALFRDASGNAATTRVLQTLRTDLQKIVTSAFDQDGARLRTRFGLAFDFREHADHVTDFSELDARRLRDALRRDPSEVTDFFFEPASGQTKGLLERLRERLDAAESTIRTTADSRGLWIRTTA